MAANKISFFSEDIDFTLKQKALVRKWISDTIRQAAKRCGELNFVFCSDNYLLDINLRYLDHNTYTDIITFDNSEDDSVIAGDIFISIDRIRENASRYSASFDNELHRVIIHGILHLLGYKDKSPHDKELMTQKEDECLARRLF